MSVQSKYVKQRAKYNELKSKLEHSISANRREHTEFIQKILQRCLDEEQQLKTEIKQRRKLNTNAGAKRKETGEIGMDKITLLPEEVLEIIVGKLRSSGDLISLSKTCKLFQRILLPTKLTWLFPEVLPHLELYLEPRHINNCRIVCSKWKEGVDLMRWNINMNKPPPLRDIFLDYPVLSLRKFSKAMTENMRNPIFGRRLTIHLHEDDYWGEEMIHVAVPLSIPPPKGIKFVERFGEQFSDIALYVRCTSSKNHFQTVRSCVENLGNVRNLTIHGYCCQLYDSELEKSLKENPFPALPHLISLDLLGVSKLFYKHVFPIYCQQLVKLSIRLEYDNMHPPLLFSTSRHPLLLENLKELMVSLDTTDVSTLFTLKCPQLQMFWLEISTPGEIAALGTRKLFEVLKHFGGNLEGLELNFQFDPLFNDLSSSEYFRALLDLQLPHLKQLKLKGWTESLDILLCMPSLQILYVDWVATLSGFNKFNKLPAEEKEACVKITEHVAMPYKSNIWTLMPSIKKIEMNYWPIVTPSLKRYPDTKQFTREGYEHFQKIQAL